MPLNKAESEKGFESIRPLQLGHRISEMVNISPPFNVRVEPRSKTVGSQTMSSASLHISGYASAAFFLDRLGYAFQQLLDTLAMRSLLECARLANNRTAIPSAISSGIEVISSSVSVM